MSRFNVRLEEKVRAEEDVEKKQVQLKEEAGIEDEDIVVKEKGVKDYSKAILRTMIYIAIVFFFFVGVITLLNPVSRNLMLTFLSQFFH